MFRVFSTQECSVPYDAALHTTWSTTVRLARKTRDGIRAPHCLRLLCRSSSSTIVSIFFLRVRRRMTHFHIGICWAPVACDRAATTLQNNRVGIVYFLHFSSSDIRSIPPFHRRAPQEKRDGTRAFLHSTHVLASGDTRQSLTYWC